jgi:hypothetical protein
LLEK